MDFDKSQRLFQVFDPGKAVDANHQGLYNVFHADRSTDPGEIAALRRILEVRVQEAGLTSDSVWPDGIIEHPAVDRAILASGGLLHDLIHIIRRAIEVGSNTEDAPTLRPGDLDQGIAQRAEEYLFRLDLTIEELLCETWTSGQCPDHPMVRDLLNDNLILYYDNGKRWYRPHPMVMSRLRKRFPDQIGPLPDDQDGDHVR